MSVFEKAKWIWQSAAAKQDEHAEFFANFTYHGAGKALLRISADSDYCVYINGELVSHGQYGDFPHYKIYDEIDVTAYLREGDNAFAVQAWYYGLDSSTYIRGEAGVLFEIVSDNAVLLSSNQNVFSRLSKTYASHREKWITPQLGCSYTYDATKEDGWITRGGEGFAQAVESERVLPMHVRPIARLTTGSAVKGVLVKQEGNRYLYDFGKEIVGDFRLRFKTECAQRVTLCYGEHIVDGWVRDKIGTRDFSIDYFAKSGDNDYLGFFRRLGLRYIELRSEQAMENICVEVLPRSYPVVEQPFVCADETLQKIYDVCVYTLRLCMHEHYEDCPWREQALYALDSRNQMLCGYYAFKEYAFPRACLKLFAETRRSDGLLPICAPAGSDLTIPSFSVHYFTQVREYGDYSGDWAFVEEIFPKLASVLSVFINAQGDGGLLKVFEDKTHWNFYEWEKSLDGQFEYTDDTKCDLILNCLYSIALREMGYICKKLQKTDIYTERVKSLNLAINKAFKRESGYYALFSKGEEYCELGNGLAILCGAATGETAEKLCEKLTSNHDWTRVTLSMKCFKYDALLAVNKEKYRDFILEDIRTTYCKMLDAGATTFWETEDGESAFENAGSLCHGWSALPVYYLQIL